MSTTSACRPAAAAPCRRRGGRGQTTLGRPRARSHVVLGRDAQAAAAPVDAARRPAGSASARPGWAVGEAPAARRASARTSGVDLGEGGRAARVEVLLGAADVRRARTTAGSRRPARHRQRPRGRPRHGARRCGPTCSPAARAGPAADELGAAVEGLVDAASDVGRRRAGRRARPRSPATSSVDVPRDGHDRRALGHRLEHGQAEPLPQARVAEHVGAGVERAPVVASATKPEQPHPTLAAAPASPHPAGPTTTSCVVGSSEPVTAATRRARFLRGSRVPTNSRYGRSVEAVGGAAPWPRSAGGRSTGSTPSGTSRSAAGSMPGGDAVVQRRLRRAEHQVGVRRRMRPRAAVERRRRRGA